MGAAKIANKSQLAQYCSTVLQDLSERPVGMITTSRPNELENKTLLDTESTLNKNGISCTRIILDENEDWTINYKLLLNCKLLFKIVHGHNNRTGFFQAILNTTKIPVTGHSLEVDLLTQNKAATKRLMHISGVATPKYFIVNSNNIAEANNYILEKSNQEIVLKPTHTNGSIGIHYSNSIDYTLWLIPHLTKTYGQIIIEDYIPGRVYTVGVVPISDFVYLTSPLEYILPEGTKIMDDKWKLNPIRKQHSLPEVTALELRNDSYKLFLQLNTRSVLRCDYIVSNDGKRYALEINSNISLSSQGDLASAFEFEGLPYEYLLFSELGNTLHSSIF